MNGRERLTLTLVAYLEGRDKIDANFLKEKLHEMLPFKNPQKVILDEKEMEVFKNLVQKHKDSGLIK